MEDEAEERTLAEEEEEEEEEELPVNSLMMSRSVICFGEDGSPTSAQFTVFVTKCSTFPLGKSHLCQEKKRHEEGRG